MVTQKDIVSDTNPCLKGHIQIARFDHWFKNVFVLPGIVAALSVTPTLLDSTLFVRAIIGLLGIGFIASSNYIINEVLDAPYDSEHPVKCNRPVPAGQVHIGLAYIQWLACMVVGIGLGWGISFDFVLTLLALWVMGCAYNMPPVRSKDVPYLDVTSEAVNNPLRMLAGWFIVAGSQMPPISLLMSYWMIGCYFMAMKRYAEYRDIGDPVRAAAYRKSFAFYSDERLLVSVMFYAAAAMLFFGAFIIRYRLELIISFPLVAWVLSVYLAAALKPNSPVQRPEGLYRERLIMIPVIICTLVMGQLLFVDIPIVHELFSPSLSLN